MIPIQDVHFAPEPQALARSGCWITSISYVKCRPSLVTRSIDALVSFETPIMFAMLEAGGLFRDAASTTRADEQVRPIQVKPCSIQRGPWPTEQVSKRLQSDAVSEFVLLQRLDR